MKRLVVFSFVLALIIINSGCSNKEKSELPVARVSLMHNQLNNDIHTLDWHVENIPNKSTKKLTFKNGNIINYEIYNHQTNKTYNLSDYKIQIHQLMDNTKTISSDEENCTVTLNPGEKYYRTIVLKALEAGEYTAKFWAISEEGTEPSMTIRFNVDTD